MAPGWPTRGMNQPYLFFGSRFQNAVEIVPRNRDLDARYYRLGGRLGQPYEDGDRTAAGGAPWTGWGSISW